MPVNAEKYKAIINDLGNNIKLVAVSKIKPAEDILEMYNLGQRDFGENYVQELVDKQTQLPQDINWHFIGHLQSNKVKYIVPFVYLIQGVDSFKLLKEINKQALKCNREIDCLLQVHIAQEETKFGFDGPELQEIFINKKEELEALKNIRIKGLMGMASFTEDINKIEKEYKYLKSLFDKYSSLSIANCQLQTLSMGMSGDYKIAINEGSTMARIGSLLFGKRVYPTV
jgi:pyridoxal phosphate enzyme (YggS family)